MAEDVLLELPRGWACTRLKEIVNVTSGYGFPKKYQGKVTGEIPFFKVSDISKSVLNGHMFLKVANNYISKKDCEEIRANPLRKGTIVFAKIGEAIKLNRRAILEQDSLVDNNVMGIYPYNETLDNLFAFFFLSTIKLGDYSRATTVPSVRKSDVEQISIPFPPFPEQRAIVSKIEQLFSDLDNGVDNFKKAHEQLKRYRQSVLKAASEGKLMPTEAELARVEGRDYEPANVLLARILEERREKWNGKGKYKEPAAPDTSMLLELPEGWRWVALDQILNTIFAGKSFRCDERIPNQNEIGVVKVSAVTWGEFNESESKTCTNSEMIKEDYFIEKGDFLFSRANTIELVGACVIVRNVNKKLMLSDKILRFNLANIPPEWVLFNLRNKFGRSEIECLATGNQESMRNIGQVRIRQIRIPLPPLVEQRRIVAEVERRLSLCDKMEATISESLEKAESLRQSILKKAFEGKLLNEKELEEARNAPDWEPAEKLLERIRT